MRPYGNPCADGRNARPASNDARTVGRWAWRPLPTHPHMGRMPRLLTPRLAAAALATAAVATILPSAAWMSSATATAAAAPPAPEKKCTLPGGLTELSGLAMSHKHPGVFYAVNDSGNTNQVFAIDCGSTTGRLRGHLHGLRRRQHRLGGAGDRQGRLGRPRDPRRRHRGQPRLPRRNHGALLRRTRPAGQRHGDAGDLPLRVRRRQARRRVAARRPRLRAALRGEQGHRRGGPACTRPCCLR